MLEASRYGTIDGIAAAEKINDLYVSRLLRLTLLAPNIVEAILDGRQRERMTLPALMEPFQVEWGWQEGARWGAKCKINQRISAGWPEADRPDDVRRAQGGPGVDCERF